MQLAHGGCCDWRVAAPGSLRRALCPSALVPRTDALQGLPQELGVSKQGWICKLRSLARAKLQLLQHDAF